MPTPLPAELANGDLRPGEFEAFSKFVETIHQRQAAAREGSDPKLRRGFHAKTHLGLIGEFHVVAPPREVPLEGLFQEQRVYPALVRFSNGDTSRHADNNPEPRGIAVKLIGVEGQKVADHESEVTQDFLATSHSVTRIVRNARQFIAVIESMKDGVPQLGALVKSPDVGLLEAARILFGLLTQVKLQHVNSMATEEYLGTAPIKWGAFAVKFGFVPRQERGPENDKHDPNYLRADLVRRLKEGELRFDFVVQFFENESDTPIEDTSEEWKSEAIRCGELVIPKCDPDSPEGQAVTALVEDLSFSPWHALSDHQPLGSIMRARKFAYPASAQKRSSTSEPRAIPNLGSLVGVPPAGTGTAS